MTLQEVLQAMQTHRVRHSMFKSDEWVTQCSNGICYFSTGESCTLDELLEEMVSDFWNEGWEIVPNPERSVG